MSLGKKGEIKMRNLFLALLVTLVLSGKAFAVTDVNETAGKVVYGTVSVSTSTYTDISTVTVISNAFAYNICNEDSTNKIRCGYDVNVSTVAGSTYQGFWVKPQECEYRAVTYGIKVYCKAEGGTAITITREVFGKP